MNEAEKERLIKKDIESIENKVRHAFNQGYEMGMKDREKLNCTDCIIEKSDDFIKSRSEIPNTCGDAVSREAVENLLWEEPTFTDALNVLTEVREKVRSLPSVTPQQRTGRWKFIVYDANRIGQYECSECHWNVLMNVSDYCPHCGARMEVDNG